MRPNTFMKPISKVSLSDQVYKSLKTAIISLELEPGQKINDMILAKNFNVSRTPIREAIKRLENECLVISEPGSETRITEINVEEVKQAFVVVATLHGLAAKLAVNNLTHQDISNLKKYNYELKINIETGKIFKSIDSDDAFHNVFLKAADNNAIYDALEKLMPKLHRLEFKKFKSVDAINSIEDHENIIKVAQNGDGSLLSSKIEHNWHSLAKQLIN